MEGERWRTEGRWNAMESNGKRTGCGQMRTMAQEKIPPALSEKNSQGKTCGKRRETGIAATKFAGVFGYNGPQSIGHLPDCRPAMSAFA